MKSLSSVGLGLSIVFGSLLLALVAELYYLLWWKKRLTSKREFFYMFCLKTSSSSSSTAHSALNPQEIRVTNDEHHLQSNKDLLLKPFDDHHGMENELMRPPRFLFTIVEETKEDLECEETKCKSKFGSVLLNVETPYLTPPASPPFFTPPHTPMDDAIQQGFDYPLFESATDAEFNKRRSSPPPKFKFLQEAEEKIHRRMLTEERVDNNGGFDDEENGEIMTLPSKYLKDEEDESFITIIVDRNKERGFNEINNQDHQQQFHSSYASQVLPLSSSPSHQPSLVPSNKTKIENFSQTFRV